MFSKAKENSETEVKRMAAFSPPVTDTTEDHQSSRDGGVMKEEEMEKVNSTATCVVKSSQSQIPLKFSRLEQNTNLHQPPSNWLKTGSHLNGRNSWVKGGTGEFSSFRMANQRPENVGEVDVISASENIKKLLKIPFSSNQVSMAVHRIENTLLLDELDLLKELRYVPESVRDWVKERLFRTVLQDGQRLTKERKTNQMLQDQNLLSKFLYHSIDEQGPNSGERESDQGRSVMPLIQQEVHKNESSDFARQVLWHFEDIRMLIGSDLPIFGEGKYPAVSLRLREETSPINVLTGMDYWLDNLMCNVPELVMCYHLEGIVQKYEVLKTEDIPHLENAKFSTKVVKDIAQNILSFLKSNCTKEGHTYWLYKGKEDDIVKLYDLTSLCGDYQNCPWDNPFIVPVALLLYRVAKNMSAMNPTKKQNAVISKLLKECVKLLQESGDTHPEILSSAYYLLTLIHINDSYDPPSKIPSGKKKALSPKNSSSQEKEVAMPMVNCHELKSPNLRSQKSLKTHVRSPKRTESPLGKNETVLDFIFKGLKYIHSSSPTTTKLPLTSPREFHRQKVGSVTSDVEPQVKLNEQALSYLSEDKPSSVDQSVKVKDTSESKMGPRLALVPSELFQRQHKNPLNSALSDSSSEMELKLDSCNREDAANVDSALVASGGASGEVLSLVEVSPCSNCLKDSHRQTKERENCEPQDFSEDSWQMDVQVSLLCQGAEVYIQMAEEEFANQQYGAALLYCRIGLACDAIKSHFHVKDPNLKEQLPLAYRFWMVSGDALLFLSHNVSSFDKEQEIFRGITEKHRFILATAEKLLASRSAVAGGPSLGIWQIELSKEKARSLQCSLDCYTNALKCDQGQSPTFLVNVARKIGNAKNELGVHIMSKASDCYKQREGDTVTKEELDLWKQSLSCFEKGIEAFDEVRDEANIALLLCNSGRLMRLCAQSHADQGSAGKDVQVSQSERHFFQKAFKYYEQALSRLVKRKKNPQIWDAISWELCTSLYNFGCLLQDCPPTLTVTQEEVEREIQECFNKALHLCDSESKSATSRPLYQYRMASIHHRLASMYHNVYRNQSVSPKQRRIYPLIEIHYNKAFKYFMEQERHLEVLRIQLERIAVLEFQLAEQTGQSSRGKSFGSILDHFVATKKSLEAIQARCSPGESAVATKCPSHLEQPPEPGGQLHNEFDSDEQKELAKLVPLMESGIQFNLLAVMKHLGHRKGNTERVEPFKKVYRNFLARTHSKEEASRAKQERIDSILEVINSIETIIRNTPLT